jgi:hypothetical protein
MLLRLIQGIAPLGLTVAIHAAVPGAMLHRFQQSIQSGPPPAFIAAVNRLYTLRHANQTRD